MSERSRLEALRTCWQHTWLPGAVIESESNGEWLLITAHGSNMALAQTDPESPTRGEFFRKEHILELDPSDTWTLIGFRPDYSPGGGCDTCRKRRAEILNRAADAKRERRWANRKKVTG